MTNPAPGSGQAVFDVRWYEKLVEFSPVGVFFTDADGNCLHVNQRWCEIAGISVEQAMGRGWLQAIHTDDIDMVTRQWYQSARTNQLFHAEYRFTTPQGKTTWVIGDARAKLAEDGRIEGYIGTITDISRTRQYFEALKESSERLHTIIEKMPVILFAFDHQGRLCAWNQEAEQVTGYLASEMIGNPHAMELLCPDPDYRRAMLDTYKQRRDDYRNWDWNLTAKDGTIRTIAFSNISRYHPLEGWANWGIGVDVTHIRKTELALQERVKELRCLYKLSILSNQSNLNLDLFLQDAIKLLPPAQQFPETSCARIILEDKIFKTDPFQVTPWKLVGNLHVRGRNIGQIEVYYTEPHPDSAEGPFQVEERLLLDEFCLQISRTIGHVLARRDLALLDELSTRAGELEHFSHSVSHDLKTPLTAIGGYAQFLHKQITQGDVTQAKACAQRIVDITAQMEHRLNEILKLAKLGKVIEPTDDIDFRDIVDETLAMMAERLQAADISVEVADEFPAALGDRTRLLEVVENLLDNAIKYIGDPPNRISIGCRFDDDEPVFFFRDNGIGIAPENLEAIFDLFWRLDKTGVGEGTGLAIARRIINAHGGRMWVESAGKGKGSCFCFTLGHMIADRPTPKA